MKSYPATWTTAQAAYFSGFLSTSVLSDSDITVEQLEDIIHECTHVTNGTSEIRFTELIARLEPRVPGHRWNEIVQRCQRIFA